MAELIDFKCPNCGGTITFSSAEQQMVCPYCRTVIPIELLNTPEQTEVSGTGESAPLAPSGTPVWNTPGQPWETEDQRNMRVYHCTSCGGEIVGDTTLGATSCPFCGNPVIMGGVFSGELKPDLIIPFKLDRNAAIEGLSNLYKGKKLIPKVFKEQSHIDEIKGVYIPFWLYSSDIDCEMNYSATKTRVWSDSKYRYTETSYYDVYRSGSQSFRYVPVDGASTVRNILTESIEPFNWIDLTEFKTPYLSGYFANRYDVDSKQSSAIATARMKTSTENALASTVVGYSHVQTKGGRTDFRNSRVSYALLPVWLLTTMWNGKSFTFAMNGQTGRLAGDDLPTDWGAFWLRFLLITLGVSAILFLILRLL